ncbi:MAG: efflux RND transporter periplasmic adaptor subunit, partial [Cellvibrionales bacterium]|nr:efflux RND transporter periplasmic adaptor subunit [Cellvibrionales bacterium]
VFTMLLINKIKKQFHLDGLNKKQQSYLLSALFAVMLIIHLLMSDLVIAGKTFAEPLEQKEKAEMYIPRVQVQRVEPESIAQPIKLYGRTAPNRVATVKAQIPSWVKALPVKEGSEVVKGDSLIQFDAQAVKEQIQSATALINQYRLEVEASKKLEAKGHQSKVKTAEKIALLENARSQLKSYKIWKNNLNVTAPFDGVLNQLLVELGDYAQTGDPVAQVVDLDPLIVNVHVPEGSIHHVVKGQKAKITLLSGDVIEGEIRYIASLSSEGTNTFLAEVAAPNPEGKLPAGISVSVDLLTDQLLGSPVSPSYLTLNDEGQSGVYVVEDSKAVFKPVDMLASTPDKLWVTNLGKHAQVVVSGHQSVIDGSPVEVIVNDDANSNDSAINKNVQ